MEDEDFQKIENFLRGVCLRIGAPDITDSQFYRIEEPGDGDDAPSRERPMTIKERVPAELEALERFFSLYDRSVHDHAILKIAGLLRQSRLQDSLDASLEVSVPTHATIVIDPGDESDAQPGLAPEIFDFRELPDLTDLRARLTILADRIREA